MKKLAALLVLFFATSQFVTAQNNEGHIAYTIAFSSDNPETQGMLGMMNGSTMNLYFNNLKSRSEFKMGGMITTTTIMDLETKKMLTLTSGMMGNNAIQGTIPNESEMDSKDDENPSEDFKITLTSETKKIIGLTAKKVIVTLEDGKTVDFWYTEEIGAHLKSQPMLAKNGIPGLLLEMVLNQSGMNISFTATSFENKLPKKNQLFNMEIPEGYTVKSAEDMMKFPGM